MKSKIFYIITGTIGGKKGVIQDGGRVWGMGQGLP